MPEGGMHQRDAAAFAQCTKGWPESATTGAQRGWWHPLRPRPKLVQPPYGLVPSHPRHLILVDAEAVDEQLDDVSGKRLAGRGRRQPHAVAGLRHARMPRGCLVALQLVPKDVGPHLRPVVGPVGRVRHPGAQGSAVRKVALVGELVRAEAASGIAYPRPALCLAEFLVVGARRRRPATHPRGPASHSRSCPSG